MDINLIHIEKLIIIFLKKLQNSEPTKAHNKAINTVIVFIREFLLDKDQYISNICEFCITHHKSLDFQTFSILLHTLASINAQCFKSYFIQIADILLEKLKTSKRPENIEEEIRLITQSLSMMQYYHEDLMVKAN